MDPADLELGLHRRDGESYVAELRFTPPGNDAEVRPAAGAPAVAAFDHERLRQLELDPAAYGLALGAALLGDPAVAAGFAQARAVAAQAGAPLRLRLYVGPSAPELHALRWETLRDAATGAPLLLGEQLLFSRYLSSGDWQPVRLRPRGALRALVAVAAPADLAAYRLAPIDAAAELARARDALAPLAVETPGDGPATLAAIAARLRDGCDILYLVAHGAMVDGAPWLFLADESGRAARVPAAELAQRVAELRERPRLVVLASCASAAPAEGGGPLAALGPRLAEAGVPAVLAMQGQISLGTAAAYMAAFFQELAREGLVDRAAAVARGAVRERDDHWMPALFMRLRAGRIWYTPGFGDERDAFEKWPALLRNLQRGHCTPIVGPHLSDELVGAPAAVARRWAEAFHFPMAPHQREDLAQVAQFLSVSQDRQFPREELIEEARAGLLERFGERLGPERERAPIGALLAAATALRAAEAGPNPYAVLAGLPCPIYINAARDTLLVEALRAAGKGPEPDLCRWNEAIATLPSVFDADPDYVPSVERPLVFQLFGTIAEPDSLVLTEDDYFDYLIGVTRNNELVPAFVREAIADTALLFLGFRLEDWSFRVLFRSIMGQEGRARRRRYASIAGQFLPEEGRFAAPERARRYLERYFDDAEISIFWGSPEDFAQELARRMAEGADRPARPPRGR